MSNLNQLKEEYEKNTQVEEQVRLLSEQVMKLYVQASAIPELHAKIPNLLETIVLKHDFSSAQKNLQLIEKECEHFMLHPSPTKQKQDEIAVGPFFSNSFAAFFKGYEDNNTPLTTQTYTVSPAA